VTAIGGGLLWVAYWLGVSGVSMVKGWNNNPLQLANPLTVAAFTTKCYVGTGLIPTGKSGDSGACTSGSSSSTPTTTNVKKGIVAGASPPIVKVAGRGR
jgi:hypothetical protein